MSIPIRKFGRDGPDLSILGFGAMRLPGFREGKYDEYMGDAAGLLRRGIELGVNYIDTAQLYNAGYSEIAVGKAISGLRDRVFISTKISPRFLASPDDLTRLIDESYDRLQTDRIDIFYFHGLDWAQFGEQLIEMKLLETAQKLQTEGRIRLICFSSHDAPENIAKLIETGAFAGMLVQYNLIDERNADVISLAHERGMGVAVMGPVGGGRLAGSGPDFQRLVPRAFENAPEMALRFVWSNPAVTTALSGMESQAVLERNLALAEGFSPLTTEQYAQLGGMNQQLEKLKEMYCTGCGYCLPCDEEVNIPGVFNLLVCHEVFGAEAAGPDSDPARQRCVALRRVRPMRGAMPPEDHHHGAAQAHPRVIVRVTASQRFRRMGVSP
jgi:predicted aldo/keto reductase-like oxidoreductase